MKPDGLFQSEHEVHIVNSLPARSLQQIVDHRDDEQLIFNFLQVDQALVRIYHLFQIRVLIRNEGKAMIRVMLLVDPLDLYEVDLTIQIRRSQSRYVVAKIPREKLPRTGMKLTWLLKLFCN